MGRHKTHGVLGKWTETRFVDKYVTFAQIVTMNKGSGLQSCFGFL
jgi:hypothetical protein